MKLFAITGPGLLATATAVFALWACIAGERAIERRAASDLRASHQALRRLRDQAAPASQPVGPFHVRKPSLS